MKRICASLFAGLLILTFSFPSFAIHFDGYDDGLEWDKSEPIVLMNGESNSNIDFAFVKYIVEPKTNVVWMCVMYRDDEIEKGEDDAGFIMTSGGEDFFCSSSGTANAPDDEHFKFEAISTINENHGVTCEVRLGIKDGISAEYPMKIQFLDAQGRYSNVYHFTIKNPKAAVSTAKPTAAKTTKAPKSTTEKRTTVKTTVPKTTVPKKTTTRIVTDGELPYTRRVRTTAPAKITKAAGGVTQKTTKVKTTKAKTSKKSGSSSKKNATEPAGTVLIMEREVIISQVYVTQENTVDNDALTTLSKGGKYKIIIICVSAVALISLAAFGASSGKKKN